MVHLEHTLTIETSSVANDYSHWNFEDLTPDSDSSTSKVPKTCLNFFFPIHIILSLEGAMKE